MCVPSFEQIERLFHALQKCVKMLLPPSIKIIDFFEMKRLFSLAKSGLGFGMTSLFYFRSYNGEKEVFYLIKTAVFYAKCFYASHCKRSEVHGEKSSLTNHLFLVVIYGCQRAFNGCFKTNLISDQ